MKTYSFEKLDLLLKNGKTIKTKEVKRGTAFLDALNNGEIAVSIDDINLGIYDNLIAADNHFENLR